MISRSLSVIMMLVLLSSVCAAYTRPKYTYEDAFTVRMSLPQGWNLLPAFIYNDATSVGNGAAIKDTAKYAFLFHGYYQDYLQIKPAKALDRPETEYDRADEYFLNSGVWVYLDTSDIIEAEVTRALILDVIPITKGWNFVAFTPSMVPKNGRGTFQDAFGDCTVEKAYVWYAPEQRWYTFPVDTDIAGDVPHGGVVVIKVAADCTLSTIATPLSPPGIPG